MNIPAVVAVKAVILGKEFMLSCPADEEEALQCAIDMLNNRINDIKLAGKVVGTDRIALMAALNLAFDLIQGPASPAVSAAEIDQATARIDGLNQQVQSYLNPPV